MKVVAFLPAKGTSERIPSKNMKLLNGKPLFLHTLEKLVACSFIDEVYLDSESDEILNYASYLDYKPLKRNAELATNKTDGHQLFYNEVLQVDADIYIQILGTSPFISAETIRKGINVLMEHEEYDSVVLMRKEKFYLWENGQPLYDKNHIPNSNTLPDMNIEAMGLYIVRKSVALDKKMRFGDNVYMLTGDAMEMIDVNYPDEFELADVMMRGIQERENAYFHLLTKFINSAVISDILFDMGVGGTIVGLEANLKEKKIMGRANTLKLRALHSGEDYRGIYDGLKTYDRMSSGEVIVVENEVADRAYFGELNAHLALRSGAIGTVINGVTRDIVEVNRLDYPVFSKGYCCADVRGNATIAGHQIELNMNGVKVLPGDIIFADQCGVVCIPRKHEKEVLKRAIEAVTTEKSILNRVLKNENAMDIYNQEGEF